jgi:hypothetical protein|tara:strand:+ start:54 stop:575 length:522 start_codon:yes stop_codon:yes gene_type:complete
MKQLLFGLPQGMPTRQWELREEAARRETEAVTAYIRHGVSQGRFYYWNKSGALMSRLDGVLVEGNALVKAVEVKWRRFDWDELVGPRKGELMIPADKVLAGQAFAYLFKLPTMLLTLLDDCLVAQMIVSEKGEKLNVLREAYEQSDKSTDGGRIYRDNCYIGIEGAERIAIGL